MIVGIEGVVELKEPTKLHLNVNGLIYEIHISINSSNSINTKDKIRLHTTQIIREDAHLLFGFVDFDEKRMFDTLLKINGVGAKVAQAVCSTFTPETFANIINAKDVSLLKRVPGIGPKSASRILVELSEFIVNSTEDSLSSSSYNEAIMALESLGFKKDAITKALVKEQGDTATLVKIALKKLQRL